MTETSPKQKLAYTWSEAKNASIIHKNY